MRFLFSFFLFISFSAFSQTGFNKSYGPTQRMARTIDTIQGSGYMVMGVIGQYYMNSWILKLDANGDTVWTKTFGTDSIQYKSYSMSSAKDGGNFICGDYQQIVTYPNMDSYLMKVDSLGNVIWFNKYGVSIQDGGGKDYAIKCKELSNGKVVSVGMAKHTYTDTSGIFNSGLFQGYISIFDSTGNNFKNRSFVYLFEPDTEQFWQSIYYTLDLEVIGNRIFVASDKSNYPNSGPSNKIVIGLNENLDTLFDFELASGINLEGISKTPADNLLLFGENYLAEIDTNGQLLWQSFPTMIIVTEAHVMRNGNIVVMSGFYAWNSIQDADLYITQYSTGKIIFSNFTPNGNFISSDTVLNIYSVARPVAMDFIPTQDNSIAFSGNYSYNVWAVKLDIGGLIPQAINVYADGSNYKVYPNPTRNLLFIDGIISASKIQIHNIEGKLLEDLKISNDFSGRTSVDVSQFSSGIYFLNIYGENGQFESLKFIIE